MDKAFDWLDHDFLSSVLRKCCVLPSVTWTEILLKDQLSCVINGGTTTQYFNIEKRSHQGDPISAYLLILMLEILVLFIETSWNKRHRDISVLYSLYCLRRWCDVLSERFTIHWIPSWNIHCFFHFFRIENKSNKMRNSGNRSPKIGSLWYEMYWST